MREYKIIFYDGNGKKSNLLEIVCAWNNRRFVSKGRTNLSLDAFYLGGAVTINSVQFHIKDAADRLTADILRKNRQRTLLVVSPGAAKNLSAIVGAAETSDDLILARMRSVRLDRDEAKTWFEMTGSGDSLDQKMWAEGPCVAMDLRGKGDVVKFARSLLGADVPASLASAVHISKDVQSANREIGFFFSSSRSSSATQTKCSVCLIKPHAVSARVVGRIIQAISDAELEISACEKLLLSKSDVAEFLRAYDFLKRFSEHKAHLCSGPVVALEVRGEDAVQRLRMLAGPYDVTVAKELKPKSIRANYGTNQVLNAVHVTDLPTDGAIESGFIFG